MTAIGAGRIIARTPRLTRGPRLPARPSAHLAIAAAVVAAAGAAFGIGFAVGTPSQRSAGVEPLQTVTAPGVPEIPGLRGDLPALPELAPPPPSSGGGGSGGSGSTGVPEEPITVVPG